MTPDNEIKKILMHGAEGASSEFTSKVMSRVLDQKVPLPYYQPLVSARLRRGFLIVFGSVVTAILCLCLALTFMGDAFMKRIISVEYTHLDYGNIFLYVITFWGLFGISSLLRRRYSK